MVIFARAEDAFDLSGRLADVTVPTLVIGGDRDAVYAPEIFARTAQGVRNGRLILYRGANHATTVTHTSLADDVAGFLGALVNAR